MSTRFALLLALALCTGRLAAQPAVSSGGITTYANPLDLDYKYNFEQTNEGISYRSGADPVVVRHRGRYYLFGTIANGYWVSDDLARWRHVVPSRWPFEDNVAPSAISVRDTLYLMQSATTPRPILYATDAETGRLEFYNRWLPIPPGAVSEGRIVPAGALPPGPWDPGMFHDQRSDRWYLYWGSSNTYPLYGVELDKARRLRYTGAVREIMRLHPDEHGWERFGRDHRDTLRPYVEGAWMTEHRGRYYLQYGAPGTEFNAYANGTYLADDPLGPFTYAPYNPVAYKPGGFVQGAGHGNTFEDAHGNFWNTGTPWIAVNWNFERRIGLHPAGFDADGQMFASTRFGDFPHRAPTAKWTSPDELFTGWMLLSYRKPATATSQRDTFAVARITDEDPRTFWVAAANRPGEGVTVDLGGEREVRAVQVNFTDYKSGLFASDSTVYTQFRLHASRDGRAWTLVGDLTRERRDRPNAYVELAAPIRARYVRYEHVYVGAANLAISDVRVFGNAGGRPPAAPQNVTARRDADPRNAFVSWRPVPGAVGYNVRWGIAPGKLYLTYQVFADRGTTLEVRALNVGVGYHFAVEAFDESGVSPLSRVVPVP